MYRVTLSDDGQTLQWQDQDAQGRTEILVDEPGDAAWWRSWHQFQSLFIDEALL